MNQALSSIIIVISFLIIMFVGCIATPPESTISTPAEPTVSAPAEPTIVSTPEPTASTTSEPTFNAKGFSVQSLWSSKMQKPLNIMIDRDGFILVRQSDNIIHTIDPNSGDILRSIQASSNSEIDRQFGSNSGEDFTLSPSGEMYRAVWSEGIIYKINTDTTKTPIISGLSKNDPIYLGFSPDGKLYFTDRRYTFAQVDVNTGSIKTFDFLKNIQSESLCLKDFDFESNGDVVFLSHTSGGLYRVSLNEELIQVIMPGTLNSPALAISPKGEFFVGDSADYPLSPSRIVKLNNEGTYSVIAEVPGHLRAITSDCNGILYATSYAWYPKENYDEFWLYKVHEDGTLQYLAHKKMGAKIFKLLTLSVSQVNGHIIGFDRKTYKIIEFSPDGTFLRSISPDVDYPIGTGRAYFDREGGIWLLVIPEEGQLCGPVVKRELYYITPQKEQKLIATIPYNGCCTMETMAIGPDSVVYLIPSPENSLLKITKAGSIEKIASSLPIDPLGISVDEDSRIVFTSSDGIYELTPK